MERGDKLSGEFDKEAPNMYLENFHKKRLIEFEIVQVGGSPKREVQRVGREVFEESKARRTMDRLAGRLIDSEIDEPFTHFARCLTIWFLSNEAMVTAGEV